MKKYTRSLLFSAVLIMGLMTLFGSVYAESDVKLNLTIKNSDGGHGIVLFHETSDEFTCDIDKTSLSSGYDIVQRTWFDQAYDYAIFKYVGYNSWFPADGQYFIPNQDYKLSYKFKLKKNGKYVDWNHNFALSDITVNGVNVGTDTFPSEMGIKAVSGQFVYSGNSDFEDIVVTVYFNKTPKLGYMTPPYQFDASNDGGFIKGGQAQNELFIDGNAAPSRVILQKIVYWFHNSKSGYDKLYFNEPSSGYGIKLPANSSDFLSEVNRKKEIHLFERSFDTSDVVTMAYMFNRSKVYGIVNFDVSKVTDMTSAFQGTKLSEVVLRGGSDIVANNMLKDVNTIEKLEFKGLKGFSIAPNTFVGDYRVVNKTKNTTEFVAKNSGYVFTDNHEYLVDLGTKEEMAPEKDTTQKVPTIGVHSDNYFKLIQDVIMYYDSKSSDWFYPYVNYVTNRQIMKGTGNGMFSPKSRITKAMLVTMLFRLSEDENVTVNNVWVDLKDSKWYTEAAKWALKNGIATANARNEFQPNHELTREEFIKMIYLYANYKGYYTGDEADLSSYVDKNMLADDCINPFKWAVQIGIINGIDTTHLAPKNTSNRAQMATIFTRFMDVYGL